MVNTFWLAVLVSRNVMPACMVVIRSPVPFGIVRDARRGWAFRLDRKDCCGHAHRQGAAIAGSQEGIA